MEVLPNGAEASGAKRYTYNTAGYLTQVETHNGSGWDVQAEMAYNGLGQRLSMDAAGVIAYYVMDGNRPLTAESNGNITSYLYGLGVIGEETDEWNFALPDGSNTPRQLTDVQGDVTLFVRYNPWGGTLETAGTGNFSIGYLGGILDAATNLIYVGNGQYYDPQTGRFLTRGVNPNSPNPYLPFDPTGLLLGPLGLLAVFYAGRRNKKSAPYVVFLIVLVVLPMSVSLACKIGVPAPAPTEQPPATGTPTPGGGSGGGGTPSDPGAAVNTPAPSPTCTDEPSTPASSTPTPTLTPTLDLYKIVFEGSWSTDEQKVILAAIQKVGEEFSRLGLGGSSWDAFKAVYGEGFLFYRGGRSGGSYCNGGSDRRTIKCFGNAPMSEIDPARLLVHELGHALVQTRYPTTRAPYVQLRDTQIVDDHPEFRGGPRWVTGTHPTKRDCESNPNLWRECAATNKPDPNDPNYNFKLAGKFERTGRGYLSTLPPYLYHGSNWDDWATSPNEDFADMFMNWLYNTFDYRSEAYDAGIKRYEFMEFNMRAWVTG